MMSDWISDDRSLLDEVGSAIRATGPIPAQVFAAAKAAIDFRTLGAGLARRTYDSSDDRKLADAFRAQAAALRSLSFMCEDPSIDFNDELCLDIDIATDFIVGQLTPATEGTIAVESLGGVVVEATIDELGMFAVDVRLSGTVRFRVEPLRRRGITTEWIRAAAPRDAR